MQHQRQVWLDRTSQLQSEQKVPCTVYDPVITIIIIINKKFCLIYELKSFWHDKYICKALLNEQQFEKGAI